MLFNKPLVSFDWALKNLLRNKANFGILEGFLTELLKEDIKILEILESEGNQENAQDKFNRVELKVKNSKGEIIIIELQNKREFDYLQRILFGTSKAVTEHIDLGKSYFNVKKIISVNLIYFDLGKGKDYVYYGKTKFKGIHNNDELQLTKKQKESYNKDEVYKIYPEYYIIKINQFDDKAKDRLDEWIYFLKNNDIEPEFKAKVLKEAKEKLNVLQLSKEERIIYDNHIEDLRYADSMAQTYKIDLAWAKKEKKEEEDKRKEERERRKIAEEKVKKEKKKGQEAEKKGKEEGLKISLQRMIEGGFSEEEARKILRLK